MNQNGQTFARETFKNGGQAIVVSVGIATRALYAITKPRVLYNASRKGLRALVIHQGSDYGKIQPDARYVRQIRLIVYLAQKRGIEVLTYIHGSAAVTHGLNTWHAMAQWHWDRVEQTGAKGTFCDGYCMSTYHWNRFKLECPGLGVIHSSVFPEQSGAGYEYLLTGERFGITSLTDPKWRFFYKTHSQCLGKIEWDSPIHKTIGWAGVTTELMNRGALRWMDWATFQKQWQVYWKRAVSPLLR